MTHWYNLFSTRLLMHLTKRISLHARYTLSQLLLNHHLLFQKKKTSFLWVTNCIWLKRDERDTRWFSRSIFTLKSQNTQTNYAFFFFIQYSFFSIHLQAHYILIIYLFEVYDCFSIILAILIESIFFIGGHFAEQHPLLRNNISLYSIYLVFLFLLL